MSDTDAPAWNDRELQECLRLYGFTLHPAADLPPPMSKSEMDGLMDSAETMGWKYPVIIDSSYRLLDGRNRLIASVRIGKDVPVVVEDHADPIAVVLATRARSNMSTSQKALMAARAVDMYAADARLRQKQAGGDRKSEGYRESLTVSATVSDSPESGTSAAHAGAQVRVSEASVERAKRVLDHGDQQLIAEVDQGRTSVNAAAQEVKRREDAVPKVDAPQPPSRTVVQLNDHKGNPYDYTLPKGKPTFNSTNDSVDWAAWTWNPVTGCLHGCHYCYARDIANQTKMRDSYPAGFTPLFHPERLPAPSNTKPGTRRAQDGRVFVCSMADLFGEWVPEPWIADVFAACNNAPEWEYLFLTKFPKRYKRIDLPPHMWAGASVDTQKRVEGTQEAMRSLDVKVRWLSIEPLLEPLTFTDLSWCDLMVIGSQTRTMQPEGPSPAFAPPFRWVSDLVAQADAAGVPVYLKPNLRTDPGMDMPQDAPKKR